MNLREWYEREQANATGIRHLTPEEANRYLDLLQVPFDQNVKLIEIGYADGSFLEQAMKRVSCVGVSDNPEHYKAASQRLGEFGPGILLDNTLEEMRSYPEKFHFLFMIGAVPNPTQWQVIQILLHRGGRYCIVDRSATFITGIREPIQ